MDIIFDSFTGPVKMAVLETAVELGIADVLEKTGSLEGIARALDLNTDPGGLGYFLDALAGLGFARKENGQYQNTALGRHFLCRKSPVCLAGLVRNMKAMQHKNLGRMAEIIRNGPPRVEGAEILSSEAKWENAVSHLAAYQRAGMASTAADIVASLPEFTTASRLLDLGCGPGLMGMEMVRRNPGLTGVLMDLPAIIRLTRKEAEKEGMTSRLSFIAGDYNNTGLGDGYDIIWASHNLYYVKDRPAFFNRVRHALTDNGVFVCLHEGLTGERTGPAQVVLSRLSLALEGQDVSFEKGELAGHIRRSGFDRVETRTLSLAAGEAELVIARKGDLP